MAGQVDLEGGSLAWFAIEADETVVFCGWC